MFIIIFLFTPYTLGSAAISFGLHLERTDRRHCTHHTTQTDGMAD
jgi:hypothetical protein